MLTQHVTLPISGDSSYFLDLYTRYRRDRFSVPADWRVYFETLDLEDPTEAVGTLAERLLEAFRRLGHLEARLDPLELDERTPVAALATLRQQARHAGAAKVRCDIGGVVRYAAVAEIEAELTQTYCGSATLEAAHLIDDAERNWLFEAFERTMAAAARPEEIERAYSSVVIADEFETFMRQRLPTKKRFGMEGAETTAVAICEVLQAASGSFSQTIMGGMHRGRLNILATIMRKSLPGLFAAILGEEDDGGDFQRCGDVPYHLGHVQDIDFGGRSMRVTLLPHPSHLLAVAPVVAGMVRGVAPSAADEVLCFLTHTDAAFSGQGLVSELMQLANLDGYGVNGTIHLIVNNQIGFTTKPAEGRSAIYCTDIAKMTGAPVLHVNGDDIDAVVRICHLAVEWRRTYRKDILIDLVCYRRNGHNELDEPRFTQPRIWAAIDARKPLRQALTDRLRVDTPAMVEDADALAAAFREALNTGYATATALHASDETPIQPPVWRGHQVEPNLLMPIVTGLPETVLKELGRLICTLPAEHQPHDKVVQFYQNRLRSIETGTELNFATAEALAFASLLNEGYSVRLSGQDCVRGTFTQRHLAVHDVVDDSTSMPIANVARTSAAFEAVNSPLSEYAVLSFEYGLSLADPGRLVLWEAQFGDFLNGAQIAVDQFVSTAEAKWGLMSGLVVLLPHGHEGQGPDHSSARIERLLQSCAESNVIIAVPSTPANLFHLLRRQMLAQWRKPLFIIAPKSLLRHKASVSPLGHLAAETAFRPVIANIPANPTAVRRVVMCYGKIFYDLAETLEREGKKDEVALVRIEQLYPFPTEYVMAVANRFENASDWVWCQEEPQNQGAWTFAREILQPLFASRTIRYAGRRRMAVTAAGSLRRHQIDQKAIVAQAIVGVAD